MEKTAKSAGMESMETKGNELTTPSQPKQELKGLQELLTPLIDEVHSLKENMDRNCNRLDEKYRQLEGPSVLKKKTLPRTSKILRTYYLDSKMK